MKSQILAPFLISTILLILLHSPAFAQDQQNVELPYRNDNLEMTPGATKFYKIDLSQRPQGVDFSLASQSYRGTSPKIYVSKNENNRFPTGTDTADYVSTSYSGNIIFISEDDLAGVQNLYVGLVCSGSKCTTGLSFEYSKEIVAQADGNRIVETSNSLQGASSAVVRLIVPDEPDAERIVIHIDAIPNNDDVANPDLQVFLAKGNDIPFTNHAENIPRASWFEGKTIVIHKDDPVFCTNCNYTLSLKFDPYSSISFEAHVFDVDTTLQGSTILDGVNAGKFNTYTYLADPERQDEDFVIDIKPQQGTPVVYINCNTRPEVPSEYYWRYNIAKPLEINLTPREHDGCKNGAYYVLVASKESSIYSIKLSSKKGSKLFVGKDEPVIGDIFPNERISYEIFVPLFAAEKVTVNLTSNPRIDMQIINCRFPTDCPGLLPAGVEFRHQIDNETGGSYNPPEFKFDLQDTEDGQAATINPHEEGCYPIIIQDDQFMKDPLPVCAYKVTLYSENLSPVEYKLRAGSIGHEWLFVGIPKLTSVLQGETSYFILNVPHPNATRVNIQLTTFSGDVDIFVSRTNNFPNEENDETQLSHEGLIIFQDQPNLNGTYYIGVYGIETSSFSLSTTVLNDQNKSEDYAQPLTLGLPQKGVLLPKHEHPAKFYKFTLDLAEDWIGTVNIAVYTLRGTVLLAVNAGNKVPLPNLHTWSSHQEVQISSDDPNFTRNGTYYIGVFVDWGVTRPDFDDITFTVLYYLKEETAGVVNEDGENVSGAQANLQHFFLSPLTPFHRSIKKTDVDYYEAFILPKDTGITIYKQADAGDVDIFVSLDPNNQYPSERKFTYTTQKTFKDYIELTEEDLTSTCQAEGSRLCTFYLAVIPKGDQDQISYSLTMKRSYNRTTSAPAATALEDGRQLQLHVPEEGKPAYFYFYSTPFNPSIITVSCPGEEVRVYANRNKTEVGKSIKPTFSPPTNESYEFASYNETSTIGIAHLTIPADFNVDSNIVSLAVYFKHPTREVNKNVDPSTLFTILVSSQMTHIYTGKPYYGAVEADKYMYFYLNVYKQNCTLLISMTTLNDGDPDLVVGTNRSEPPTIDAHQFASISKHRTELLEIGTLDIYPKDSMEGTWVIGVYGRTNSTFTLTVLDEDEKMVSLKADTPFQMSMRENTKMYFKYYHGKAEDVEIRLDQLSGKVMAHITTVDSGETESDIVTILANEEGHKWMVDPNYESSLSIPKADPKACTDCMYLIVIESETTSKLSITITEGERFIKLQNGMTYTNELEPSKSKLYLFSSSNAEEVTLSVSLRGSAAKIFASHNPEVSEETALWSATLTSNEPRATLDFDKSKINENDAYKAVWNGLEYVQSQKDAFYIKFENPDEQDVISYTFTVTSKDSNAILKTGSKHMLKLDKGESTSLLYYTSKNDEVLKFNLEFLVSRDTTFGRDEEFDRNLRRGVPVTATYWSEKATASTGREVTLVKDHVMKDKVKTNSGTKAYHIREGFTLESSIGKYRFDIENPFDTDIEVWATAYTSEFGSLALDQNSQHSSTLTGGVSETYEVYLAGKGAWYLWAYSCSGSVGFSAANNPDDLGNNRYMGVNQDELRGEKIPEAITMYARLETPQTTGDSQFILSSKFFPNEEIYKYQTSQPAKSSIRANSQYQGHNSTVSVAVDPVDITGYDTDDDVVYHLKVCPAKPNDPNGPANLCNIHEECRLYQTQFKIDRQSSVSTTFDRLQPGTYYVHATADIHHQEQFIKFVPYPAQVLTIGEPITEKVNNSFGIILLILLGVALLAFACYKFYGKFQKYSEEKGFELPNIGKKRGYGFLGDDL